MEIQKVKDASDGGYIITLMNGTVLNTPGDTANRHYQEVQDWINNGNIPNPVGSLPGPSRTSPLTSKEWEEILVAKSIITAADIVTKKNTRA